MNLEECLEKGLLKRTRTEAAKVRGSLGLAEHFLGHATGVLAQEYYDGVNEIGGFQYIVSFKEPAADFKEVAGIFITTFRRKVTEGKSSQKSSQKILEILKANGNATIEEISASLGLTGRAVKKQLAKLKKDGAITRVGPDKGGRWGVR